MKTKWIITLIVIIGLVVFGLNYQSLFKTIVPPKPVVVSSYADGSSSKLFEYSVKVVGSIRNDGGDGYVVAEATVSQDGETWTKTDQIFLGSYETAAVEFVFDEVRLLRQTPEYDLRVHALGY